MEQTAVKTPQETKLPPRKHGTRHHLWWPKVCYRTRLEKSFRDHPLNSITLDESIHNSLHHHSDSPQKPSEEFMRQFLQDNPRVVKPRYPNTKPNPVKNHKFIKRSVTIVLKTPTKPGDALRVSCKGSGNGHCFEPIVESTNIDKPPARPNKKIPLIKTRPKSDHH